jgi:adenosylcobalamin-dependent ribonucleoside-triphosphate reductase
MLKVRDLAPGMGSAVAERTVLRKKPVSQYLRYSGPDYGIPAFLAEHGFEGCEFSLLEDNGQTILDVTTKTKVYETWGDVAARVASGNTWLHPSGSVDEYLTLRKHIAKGMNLMSGRHLQHGDPDQPNRNQEVFTNCSTSATSFTLFMLLLNGSGVGRCYDDDFVLTDWDYSPNLRLVISNTHADFDWQSDEDVRDARHKYRGRNVVWHEVDDSREGWAKAIEIFELMTWEKIHQHKTLVLDFSKVRPKGAPIMGMQGRPSSGPKPLMGALAKLSTIKGSGLAPWMQALYADHYLAECVLVGGARRAARMSTKWWGDEGVLDFIRVKRPVEYDGLSMDEVTKLRQERTAQGLPPLQSFLWSSNNSVMVDTEFWDRVDEALQLVANAKTQAHMSRKTRHAYKVWTALTECAYADGTGEPGIINADQLVQKDEGWEELAKGVFAGSKKYQVEEDTQLYLSKLARAALKKPLHMITNPCGEIALTVLGGFCVIADTVPFHADSFAEIEEVMRATTRALMRVNLMDSLYNKEVKRTNRIGVGMTGVHEFAWKFFRCGFRDLIDPDFDAMEDLRPDLHAVLEYNNPKIRSALFWSYLSHLSNTVVEEAKAYAAVLGVAVPHTALTIKPAGTTSKLFGLTEGWHLPSMLEFLRWVQFRSDDPLVATYRAKGYPTRELKSYTGTTIVGFPTQPTICTLGIPEDKLVTAAEATPDEQFLWLRLGEAFWINGQSSLEDTASGHGYGNQISYSLKYNPQLVDYEDFAKMLLANQRKVRACSVMPQEDGVAYEYQPETPLPKGEYDRIAAGITEQMSEDIGREHLDCSTGACPIELKEGDK